eukprot:TRINITY_DN37787_c0_g1_i2.p1 TRINITY_DN37787_c0_g1~~TRINITY_DN37787_c0_g1_i2.p1  ORF type:complete len:461 (-),score=87.21 TRINITY_DN37787_c0_g1_i2:76-1458(-)
MEVLRRPSRCLILASAIAAAMVQGQVGDPELSKYYAEDAACTEPMKSCQLGGTIEVPDGIDGPDAKYKSVAPQIERGLCVLQKDSDTGLACWDLCSAKHPEEEWRNPAVIEPALENGKRTTAALPVYAAKLFVREVRKRFNAQVQCPCEQCPELWRKQFEKKYGKSIPKDHSICVVADEEHNGRACWNKCDFDKTADSYAQGAPTGDPNGGISVKVKEFRDSGACQHKPWLPWVIAILVVIILIGLCGLVYFSRNRRLYKSFQRDNEDFGGSSELLDGQDDSVVDDGSELQQDYPEPEHAGERALAPEMAAAPGQFGSARHRSFEVEGSGMPADVPHSSSMRIPGLDHPSLPMPGNIQPQPFVTPTVPAQAATPGLTLGAQPLLPVSGSQPAGSPFGQSGSIQLNPYQAGAVPMGAFQTQLPTFSTQIPHATPSNSYQVSPATAAYAQQPMIQGAIRRVG